MFKTKTRPLLILITMLIFSLPSYSQIPWPVKPINLQVFPSDTKIEKLKNVMFAFSNALGVNCIHCHVAKDKSDFSTYDFASDNNVNKKKARLMLKLVFSINNKSIKEIAALSDEKNLCLSIVQLVTGVMLNLCPLKMYYMRK